MEIPFKSEKSYITIALMASQGNKNPNKSGKPPSRPRDRARMADFNDKKSQKSGDWNDLADTEHKNLEAQAKFAAAEQNGRGKNPRAQGARRGQQQQTQQITTNAMKTSEQMSNRKETRRMPWEPTESTRKSTTETPPRDEPICHGAARGGKKVTNRVCHNLDLSQFVILVRESYNVLKKTREQLSRTCPFAMYQHYCCTLLNAYMLDYQRNTNRHPHLQQYPGILQTILAKGYVIPEPIYDYIVNLGNMMTPNGERITWNLPTAAIPRGVQTIRVGEEELAYDMYVESGSFGPPTAANHNVYECYISPFVTQQYITATIEGQGPNDPAEWQVFPDAWTADIPHVTATPNLLGYWPIEKIHREGVNELNQCIFTNDDTILGRLAFSFQVMNTTDRVLRSMDDKLKLKPCDFKTEENSSIFNFKHSVTEIDSTQRLVDFTAEIESPFSFGADSANKTNFFGTKRLRNDDSPGVCLLSDGDVPADWLESRNNNFELTAPFEAQPAYQDRLTLREVNFQENAGTGSTRNDLHVWLMDMLNK